jgi:hypothetical protein
MLKSYKSLSFSLNWIGHISSTTAIIDTNFIPISASVRWQSNFHLDLNQTEDKDFIQLFSELVQELKTRLKYIFLTNKLIEVMNEKNTEVSTPNQGSRFKNYFNKI